MSNITNTLTVGELRALLDQYRDDTPVMFVTKDSPVQVCAVNHAIEMGWTIGEGDALKIVPPTDQKRTGFMVGLISWMTLNKKIERKIK